MKYRFAFDLGTNSIGWAVLCLDKKSKDTSGLIDGGVRIFSDGRVSRTGASLAEDRRLARQARRRHDRYIRRRKVLLRLLVENGLMPKDQGERKALELLDPYVLRAKGLDERLTFHELGRALFHLNQRRGFKSNRKTDRNSDTGIIKESTRRMEERLLAEEARTFGEFLAMRHAEGEPTRVRKTGKGAKALYEYYPTRQMLEDEFAALWEKQASLNSGLTEELRDTLCDHIFYQRPIGPVKPGRCTLNPDEGRAPKALPLSQRVRILQELNHLRIISPNLETRPLSIEERDILYAELLQKKQMAFGTMRRKLKLDSEHTFSLEGENRDKLKGDETGGVLGSRKCFGPAWYTLSLEEQSSIVKLLLDTENEDDVLNTLTEVWGLSEETAAVVSAVSLPSGYGRLGCTALAGVHSALVEAVIPYSEAVKRAGFLSHSAFDSEKIWERLPYYGVVLGRHIGTGTGKPTDRQEKQLGRISNPTVHIALNQLRRVVNELLKTYGHPEQIVVEVARELKQGVVQRKKTEKRQADQKEANKRRCQELEEAGIAPTREAMLRLRLWEELNPDAAARRCPYTGEQICRKRLFSDEVEIEHILPFARTLDDSLANKTLGMRYANRFKGNRTPHEAFSGSPDRYDWQGIAARAAQLPDNKRWRFTEEAMERYTEDGDFIARQLTDTQYLSKMAREYLCSVCNKNNVWVTPGRLTSLLAKRWGLPKKNRDNHRHHFVDACLIGVTDRRILQQVATRHARDMAQGVERFLADVPEPWEGFRRDVLEHAERIIVSHKADHGVQGQLHNSTAYGFMSHPDRRGQAQHRVALETLDTPETLLKIKGRKVAVQLLQHLTGMTTKNGYAQLEELYALPPKEAQKRLKNIVSMEKKEYAEELERFSRKTGIRRVRIVENVALIPIRDRAGNIYKGFKGDSNAYYPIYQQEDGTWTGEIVSTFEANAHGDDGAPDLPVVTKLHMNDMLEIEHEGRRVIVRVQKLSAKQIVLAGHDETNTRIRDKDDNDPFNYIRKSSPAVLQKAKARPVHVTPCGRLIYPEVP